MRKSEFSRPNTQLAIKQFAKDVGISLNHAKFIESMREHYLTREHDYFKKAPKKSPKEKIRMG